MLAGLLVSKTSFATPQVFCEPNKPSYCTQPVRNGDTVAFDGVVLSPDKAIDLGQKAEHCPELIKLETDRLVSTSSIVLKTERKEHQIDINVRDRTIEYWKQRAQEAEGQPFYVKPVFVASVTAVLTILTVVVAAESIKAAAR